MLSIFTFFYHLFNSIVPIITWIITSVLATFFLYTDTVTVFSYLFGKKESDDEKRNIITRIVMLIIGILIFIVMGAAIVSGLNYFEGLLFKNNSIDVFVRFLGGESV